MPDNAVGRAAARATLGTTTADVLDVVADPLSIVKKIGTIAVCATGVISSAASARFTEPKLVDVASAFTATNAAYVVYQESQLEQLTTTQQVTASVKNKIDRLKNMNLSLEAEIGSLEQKMARMNKVEEGFQKIVDDSAYNADTVMAIVKKHGDVQKKMENVMKARLMQDVMSIIIRGDSSGDFKLDETELEYLLLRMSMQPGIRFDEKRFRKKLGKVEDYSVKTILKMFRNLMDENPDDDHKLFSIDTKEMIM